MWDNFLTVLGICVAFGGIFIVNRMFPNPAKAKKEKPVARYVPHHIDEYGNVVMVQKFDKYV